MTNKVVEKYLNNFSLINIEGMEAFAREQSKLLSPDLVATTTDYRGTLTEYGIDGFFHGLSVWSKYFQSNHQSRKEFLEDTPTRVSVRVLNRLGLVVPVNGKSVSKEDEHEWMEEFEVGPGGLITKVHVVIHFKEPKPVELTSYRQGFLTVGAIGHLRNVFTIDPLWTATAGSAPLSAFGFDGGGSARLRTSPLKTRNLPNL